MTDKPLKPLVAAEKQVPIDVAKRKQAEITTLLAPKEIRDVHPIVQAAIDAIDKDPNDHIQWDKPSMHKYMGRAGHADFRILYHGVWIDIECKADMWIEYPIKLLTGSKARKELPSALQRDQLEKTELAGGLALVVDIHTAHLVKDVLSLILWDAHELSEIRHYLAHYYLLKSDREWSEINQYINPLHWKQFALPKPEVTL